MQSQAPARRYVNGTSGLYAAPDKAELDALDTAALWQLIGDAGYAVMRCLEHDGDPGCGLVLLSAQYLQDAEAS